MKHHNDVCLIVNDASAKATNVLEQMMTRLVAQLVANSLDPILSTRLSDESYRGLVNYVKATATDAPIGEIQKALEYVYENVPTTNCA